MEKPPLAFPISDFCRATGLGRSTIYREIAAGRLRTVKVGRRRLVPFDEGQAWLRSLMDTEAGEAVADGSRLIRISPEGEREWLKSLEKGEPGDGVNMQPKSRKPR